MWEDNARHAENIYGAFVDWEERYYLCPECGEPIYEVDWSEDELAFELCPICGFDDQEVEKTIDNYNFL